MNSTVREVRVYADWETLRKPCLMGRLTFNRVRGKDLFAFEYDDKWLSSGHVCELDPDLGLFQGLQYLKAPKTNFDIFLDSFPDRWGRVLMRRREAIYADKVGRPTRVLSELDYLLGVYDRQRMGAIRFLEGPNDLFLNADERVATPPWTSLSNLERASLMLERDDKVLNHTEAANWLNQLLAPGSSLGGARPKAGVLDKSGALWIAKFPSRSDDWDMGAWEFTVNSLACEVGLSVPEAKCLKLGSRHHTFLSKRFDRSANGQRLHFASAMTLTGHVDGASATSGTSYLDLADFIIAKGASPVSDLAELWYRMVFNIYVSNTDDHLRNHGFLLDKQGGWLLSPAYDINANPDGDALTLNITEHDNRLEPELALAVAHHFRLNLGDARKRMESIRKSVARWRIVASRNKITRSQQELMASAFRLAER